MVCLHGFLGEPEDWQPVIAALPPTFRVRAPVLPGHDGTPPPGERFEAIVDALWTRMAPELPTRFALVGYSLGGRLALALAARHPQRLSALVLEGAHPGLQTELERQARCDHDAAWAERFLDTPWPEALDAWYRQPVFADLSEERRQALVQQRARHNPRHLAATLRAVSLGRQPDLRPTLKALQIPIAYIAGARDKKFSAIADMLTGETPHLRRFKLEGVGHNCHAAAPEAVAQIIQLICTEQHA